MLPSKDTWSVFAGGVGLGLLGGFILSKLRTANGKQPKRYGAVIGLNPEREVEYKKLHSAVWPAILQRIHDSNIRNFVIYHHKNVGGKQYLFSHFEYIGEDFEADMAAIAADEETKKWWSVCEPCQVPLKWEGKPPSQGGTGGESGEWWSSMQECFHCGHSPLGFN